MSKTSVNPNCTCNATRADHACKCDAITDPATLVNLVAILTLEGKPTHKTNEQLRYALDRLIDERVEKRLAEKKRSLAEIMAAARAAEAAAKKTRGQEIAEDFVTMVGDTAYIGIDGGRDCSIIRAVGHLDLGKFLADTRAAIAALIDKAIAEEREACAKIAADWVPWNRIGPNGPHLRESQLIAAICDRK